MEHSFSESENTATVVISHRIKSGQEKNYEAWLNQIIPIAKQSQGHLGVSVIPPVAGASVTYTIIIRYDTRENLLKWMHSDTRKILINNVQGLLAENDAFEVKSGLDFWFTPEKVKAQIPVRWKQFLVTWSAIFPLVLGISYVIALLTAYFEISLPHVLKTLFLTFFVVLSMVYCVMPRYTKLVHGWLFK